MTSPAAPEETRTPRRADKRALAKTRALAPCTRARARVIMQMHRLVRSELRQPPEPHQRVYERTSVTESALAGERITGVRVRRSAGAAFGDRKRVNLESAWLYAI